MEISKSLQEEILTVQTKLKNAIRDHQICVGKLKDDPNNTDILGQIQKIHLHIVSLGRCQKQVVQRLRKEVETFKAENANGAKVSIASLLGLNNNNHITNNNETKLKTGNDFTTKSSKEDYEEIVRNGDVLLPRRNPAPTKERPSSVETISGEDDVIEVSMDENSNEKSEKDDPDDCKIESTEKINFLNALGLITTTTCAELQNKRAERKRRSTANPQFVYSSLEVPTKRKRHSYLQSGNVPQTRQTTARMNGPSPPPVKVVPPKSTSPPTPRTVMKSLIPVQKSTTRPNILRSVTESKVFPNKNKVENGPSQIQLPVPTVKSVHSVGNKAVHIPGLPSSLTIERISSDSAVCISCRNPGTLTVCENCASNYHVSCHSVSPAPPRICPKCALIEEEEIEDGDDGEEEDGGRPTFKKDEEFATATHAPGIIRKAREDAEIYKAACGLHKTDATQKKRGFTASIGISQLPSSTFLIPISSNSVNQSDIGSSATINSDHRESSMSYSSIVLNQLPRSSIAYIDRAEPQVSYAYQLPVTSVQSEKHQSYLIVKKITEPIRRTSQSSDDQNHATVLNYKLPTTSGYNSRIQTEIAVSDSAMLIGKQLSDAVSRNRKKQTNRAVPALNRIIDAENLSITAKYQLERTSLNGRKSRSRQPRNKFGINQLRSARATEILLPSYDSTESDKQLQITKSTEPEETTLFSSRPKYRPRTGGLLHSLFSGHNKSYILTDNSRESRDVGAANKDISVGRQQLYHQSYQLESGERNEPTVQLQRGALTKFFEHVKLEEAHIPAPSRAKLVYKSGTTSERNELEVTEIADEDTNSSEYATKTPLSSSNFEDDFVGREIKQNNWLSSKIIVKKGQKNDTIKSAESHDSAPSKSIRSSDFVTYERKHGNTYVRVECGPDDEEDNALTASLCNAQNNFLELRNEVSVPDDKADSERQDLSSGRRSTSSSSGSSTSSSSTSDSDTPEQAMNDSIKYSRRRLSGNEYKERLGITAVSPESMQVLEQFESAMLETGCSNAATC
ncbi:PHD finger protein 21A [Eufriesea mexicana]|nr:PHD finger protein 21A [Eufriesea mexicana]